ncbi:hypothetical protein [Cellvibrio sp.]|jgi:hypothetical protein
MIFRRLFKHRGLGVNLIAGFSFLMLAVYGWGLDWEDLGGYLLVILIVLVGLIGLAALLGWLLRKFMSRGENTYPAATTKNDEEHDEKEQNNEEQQTKRD